MTDNEIFINILKCAVNGKQLQLSDPVDMDDLWKMATRHSVRALAASVLIKSDCITDEKYEYVWKEALYKNIRKTMLFDTEREEIYRVLEKTGVWYAPLKGIIINRLFPVFGSRDFSDNDILIGKTDLDVLEREMKTIGYELEPSSISVDYTFYKPPMMNFELHHRLFLEDERYRYFNRYFDRINERLVPVGDSDYAFSLSNEDNYAYIMAHFCKHFKNSGLGVRALADVYLYKKKIPMDNDRLDTIFEEMHISDFVDSLEDLAQRLFDGDHAFSFSDCSEDERKLLEEMLKLGAFGSFNNYVSHRYSRYNNGKTNNGKLRYFRKRLFPSIEPYKKRYPTLYKHKVLHPLFYVYRPIRGIAVNRKAIRAEIKTVSKINKEKPENKD